MRNRRNIRGRQPNYARKRRLFSVFLLILAIVALTGGTYAWFSNNNVVDVTGVDIGVGPGNSLEISTDATPDSWKKNISLDDIKDADYSYGTTRYNSYPDMYRPASSIGTINNGYSEFFLGHISKDATGAYTIAAEAINEMDGADGYILSFDLYFRTAKEQYLNLDTGNSSVTYTKLDTDVNDLQGIENSLRLGFIYEGYTESDDTVANIQAIMTTNPDNIKVWEPNNNVHNQKAILAAQDFYGLNINASTVVAYEGVKAPIPENLHVPLGVSNSTYFESLGSKLISTSKNAAGEQRMFRLKSGITKLRIYAWVEGQDVDCENAVSGTSFEIKLNFTTSD